MVADFQLETFFWGLLVGLCAHMFDGILTRPSHGDASVALDKGKKSGILNAIPSLRWRRRRQFVSIKTVQYDKD